MEASDLHDSHLGGVSVPGLLSTAVPIREQFRCRRWWLFHHDLRAFTTSWLPLPIFTTYRVLLAIYTFIWLILHINARSEDFGPFWLIFLTNLSYTLLMFTTLALAVLCVVYTIVHYCNSTLLLKFIPRKDFPVARIYKQDNIPWYAKIVWLLYNVACSSAFLVFLGYWIFIYIPCVGVDSTQDGLSADGSGDRNNATTEAGDGGSGESLQLSCSSPDVYTIQVHGINVVIVFLDLLLSRIPYLFFHFVYASLFTTAYVIFTLIYWRTGGVNHQGQPYVYTTLDYGGSAISAFYAIVIIVAPMLTFIVLALLSWLRDLASVCIGCCFRDVKQLPYRDSKDDTPERNGMKEDMEHITII